MTVNTLPPPQFTITGSIQEHPITWGVCSVLWVLSCLLVWKLELLALDRTQRSGYTLYRTPAGAASKKPAEQKLPWYLPKIGSKWTPECKDLLARYANIPVSEQEAHIMKIRDAAFQTSPLATIGEFWFLVLGLAEHPRYSQIIQRLVSAPDTSKRMLIDLGTCLGQDLRKLVLDGASPSQLAGIDKFGEFEELGFNLFLDNNNFAQVFAQADIFDHSESNFLVQTVGSWEIVISSMFLHAFNWQMQGLIVDRMIGLTKGRGSWLAGLLAGDVEEQDVPVLPPLVPEGMKVTRFIHSKESLTRLFREAEKRLNCKLRIEVSYQEEKNSIYTKEIQTGYFTTKNARLLFYFVEVL